MSGFSLASLVLLCSPYPLLSSPYPLDELLTPSFASDSPSSMKEELPGPLRAHGMGWFKGPQKPDRNTRLCYLVSSPQVARCKWPAVAWTHFVVASFDAEKFLLPPWLLFQSTSPPPLRNLVYTKSWVFQELSQSSAGCLGFPYPTWRSFSWRKVKLENLTCRFML